MSENSQPEPVLLSAVERAVRRAALALYRRQISVGEALAGVTAAMGTPKDAEATPRELTAAARKSHRASVVAEVMLYEREGKGRKAASNLARRNAMDPLDPVEVDNLENKYRRWCRAEKRAHARLPSAESTRK